MLADASGRYTPTAWASKAIALYRQHQADRVVAETNQGGQMVETTLRAVDQSVSYRGVHANRGKITRAEPISALYEQGKVHHVGAFSELEDQLCSYMPGSVGSPDRLDALVYALTDLMGGGGNTGMIDYYARLAEEQAAYVPPLPGGASFDATPSAGAYPIRTIAPEGTSTVQLITGRSVAIGTDGVVWMSAEEAGPMRVAGWTVPDLPKEQAYG